MFGAVACASYACTDAFHGKYDDGYRQHEDYSRIVAAGG